MEDLLKDLNAAQREAVTTTEGFVRVIAGAGSGKTRALVRRFAYLVNELGILSGNILCVTFTNKAANEMRQRIHNLIGDNDAGYISTFHGFCVSVLQEDANAVQYPKSFLVLDNADIDDMLKTVYEERGLTLRNMTFSAARDMIEMQKTEKKPEYYLDMLRLSPETLYAKYQNAETVEDVIFYGYLYQQKKCFGLDYNDLIKFTLYIFSQDEEIRLKWQKRLEYIMIDEFQDIDALQYELMEVLCAYHKNLFVVGDPDQTIYTWRGASIRFLMDFDRRFPGTKTIMMMENYRSSPQILAAANSLIARNGERMKKELLPTLPDGPGVLCHHADTAEKEADWIAGQIRALGEQGAAYREIAVLYRAHYITRGIENALLRVKLPYHIYSGVPFYARAEVKDALSYLRMIAYRDDLSFRRIANVPKRSLGERRMRFLEEYAARNGCTLYEALKRSLEDELFHRTGAAQLVRLVESLGANCFERPVSELLSEVLDKSGYEAMLRTEGSQERLDNLAELRQSVFEYETTCGEESVLTHYLAHTALFAAAPAEDGGDRVKLMTVHAAKGLEFPYVFLCAMNEGVFPSKKTDTKERMEEERRLAFVAMTRAQKRLYLSEAEGWNLDSSPRYPSRFVLDIDPELLEYDKKPAESLIALARSRIAESERHLSANTPPLLLEPGARVRHAVFGDGTVVGVDADRGAHVIRFDDMNTARAISFRAKLERLSP
ncbi:MAG: UvrD-helicase domain-containing protein [Oscillospiraceae bacterium]|nr:UvrD-helicase domain-containing protein [Oscillospiraceae bacterium]